LVTGRTLYDHVALVLATLPVLTIWLTLVTAPMAIYMALRHWNSPSSLLRRSRIRFVLAIILGALQIAGWLAVVASRT
jgi:hypothetical protein